LLISAFTIALQAFMFCEICALHALLHFASTGEAMRPAPKRTAANDVNTFLLVIRAPFSLHGRSAQPILFESPPRHRQSCRDSVVGFWTTVVKRTAQPAWLDEPHILG
jgi:hypothetical protein